MQHKNKLGYLLGFDLGIRVWFVALARTKLAKRNEPKGNP
jgi:hypothetical protein